MYGLFEMKISLRPDRLRACAAAAVMACAIAVAGPNSALAETAAPAVTSADAMFAASFKEPGGTVQKFDQLKGKVSVVYFWATW